MVVGVFGGVEGVLCGEYVFPHQVSFGVVLVFCPSAAAVGDCCQAAVFVIGIAFCYEPVGGRYAVQFCFVLPGLFRYFSSGFVIGYSGIAVEPFFHRYPFFGRVVSSVIFIPGGVSHGIGG
ncbi:hypothetical protein CLHUN_18770 [Ruminiclostridium hungatei]|uniref:Uncharacterized protein n=1 Tax=Ruminiclostridium hungatei TaxID=48256 RepID=A0A1V4SK95_RUMHU|nr:hypothetical protein CLHUN_18770 [Ruminiclostridium hungatei]